jgi:hypothetical protein
MDVENPLQIDNVPVAKLVCIEVIGRPIEDLESESAEYLEIEPNVVNIQVSCNNFMYKAFSCFCAFIGCLVCFCGLFIFLTGFPFV